MLVSPCVSPALGVYVTSPHHVTHRQGQGLVRYRRDRYGAKSAPPQVWHKRSQYVNSQQKSNRIQHQHVPATSSSSRVLPRNCSTAGTTRRLRHHRQNHNNTAADSSSNENSHSQHIKLSVDDVLWLAEQTREMTSLENRRSVMEEAQKTIRQETSIPDNSRPHSVIGVGLQAMTSPMPLPAKSRHKPGQVDHIPTLLSLPSDRTFIPSSDQDHARHVTTPADETTTDVLEQEEREERAQSVAKQCCEIMGPSLCRTCRKLESRLLNREQAEKECPRMRITQENITTTQVVKRLYPRLTDSEIQDKIARGEIARTGFPPPRCRRHRGRFDSTSSGEDSDDSDLEHGSSSEESSSKKEVKINKQKVAFHCQHVSTLMLELTKLKDRLKNQTSTPLFFTDLKRIQAKILSGEVDRKKYLTKPPKEPPRLKSAVSSISTASSTKTTLSKLGVRLSESLMPVFVSPRKVKTHEEPSYKAFYEPPLLPKRRQIPNPSFFAGSSETYSLPERLPDIIEFADSKIKLLEKQGRSASSMSMLSNLSEDYENMMSERAGGESGRSGGDNNTLSVSSSQRDLKMQLVIQEQCEHETKSNQGDEPLIEAHDDPDEEELIKIGEENNNNNVIIEKITDDNVKIKASESDDLGSHHNKEESEHFRQLDEHRTRQEMNDEAKKLENDSAGQVSGNSDARKGIMNNHLDKDMRNKEDDLPENEGDRLTNNNSCSQITDNTGCDVNINETSSLDAELKDDETAKCIITSNDLNGIRAINIPDGDVSENTNTNIMYGVIGEEGGGDFEYERNDDNDGNIEEPGSSSMIDCINKSLLIPVIQPNDGDDYDNDNDNGVGGDDDDDDDDDIKQLRVSPTGFMASFLNTNVSEEEPDADDSGMTNEEQPGSVMRQEDSDDGLVSCLDGSAVVHHSETQYGRQGESREEDDLHDGLGLDEQSHYSDHDDDDDEEEEEEEKDDDDDDDDDDEEEEEEVRGHSTRQSIYSDD